MGRSFGNPAGPFGDAAVDHGAGEKAGGAAAANAGIIARGATERPLAKSRIGC